MRIAKEGIMPTALAVFTSVPADSQTNVRPQAVCSNRRKGEYYYI